MFNVGDQVYQLIQTRTVKKGDIGKVINAHVNINGRQAYYEILFASIAGHRLRYEDEIAVVTPAMLANLTGQAPTASSSPSLNPKFKVGDQVSVTQKSSSFWSQSAKVVSVTLGTSQWIYTVEFQGGTREVFYEQHLIASTAPTTQASATPKNPFGNLWGSPQSTQDRLSKKDTSKQCTCPMQGPQGLLAVGCKCGAVSPYNPNP